MSAILSSIEIGAAAVVRIPSLTMFANSGRAIGELSLRGILGAFKAVGVDLENAPLLKPMLKDRAFNKYAADVVLTSAILNGVVGLALWEFSHAVFGPPHPIYNKVLGTFSPLQISSHSVIGSYFN